MEKLNRLILIGNTSFAEVAYEYFSHDSPFEVVAFSVEREYLNKECLFGLPVIPFEEIEQHYVPEEHAFFVASTYTQQNQLRKRLYSEAREKGYAPASYISSRAFVWHNCEIGPHCFIFEDNTVQPFVRIGENTVLWSGNHIGHHSVLGSHCFISSHVVVSGHCQIGDACFIGVNATVANNLTIGNKCVVGAGALVLADVEDDKTVVGMWKGSSPQSKNT